MIKKIKQLIKYYKVNKTFNEDLDESRFAPPLLNLDYHIPKYKIKVSHHEIDLLQVCINNRLNLQELIDYGNGKRV